MQVKATIRKLAGEALIAIADGREFTITSSYQNSVGIYFAIDFTDSLHEEVPLIDPQNTR